MVKPTDIFTGDVNSVDDIANFYVNRWEANGAVASDFRKSARFNRKIAAEHRLMAEEWEAEGGKNAEYAVRLRESVAIREATAVLCDVRSA